MHIKVQKINRTVTRAVSRFAKTADENLQMLSKSWVNTLVSPTVKSSLGSEAGRKAIDCSATRLTIFRNPSSLRKADGKR